MSFLRAEGHEDLHGIDTSCFPILTKIFYSPLKYSELRPFCYLDV